MRVDTHLPRARHRNFVRHDRLQVDAFTARLAGDPFGLLELLVGRHHCLKSNRVRGCFLVRIEAHRWGALAPGCATVCLFGVDRWRRLLVSVEYVTREAFKCRQSN